MLKRVLSALLIFTAVGAVAGQTRQDHLDPWYRGFNEKYFGSELPQTVVISHNLYDGRFQALTEYANGYYHIEFNPKYNQAGRTELFTLLHEMCHIRQLSSNENDFDDHGPKWQSCMHELANKGAFEDLW